MIPLTGSADDGKRSSLYVTFARGFPKGDNSTYPFGVPQTCGVGGIEWVTRGSLFLHDVIERTQLFISFFGFFWFDVIVGHSDAILASS